jgi:hypothetical protein
MKYILTRIVEVNNSWYTTFSPGAILGLAHEYPDFNSWLKDNLAPEYESEFRKVESQCYLSNVDSFKDLNMDKFFTRGYSRALHDEVPLTIMNRVGT